MSRGQRRPRAVSLKFSIIFREFCTNGPFLIYSSAFVYTLPFIANRRLIKNEKSTKRRKKRSLSSGTKEKEFMMELYGIKGTSF